MRQTIVITRRDAIRLAALATLASPLVAACGTNEKGLPGGRDGAGGRLELVGSDVDRVAGDPAAIPDVVAAMHRFAGGVYGGLPTDGNLVLSPYSIAVALGMTLTGAGGTTANEMRTVLGADARFHPGLNALSAHVEGLAGRQKGRGGNDAEIALDAANQLFGQRGVDWEQPFLDVLAEQYGAGMRVVDFETATEKARALINDWVEDRTHDRIEDLIPDGVLDSLTRLVLVNAIYFKAPWEAPFVKGMTASAPFHRLDGSSVDVEMMAGAPTYGSLVHGDGWNAATLPYAGGKLAMTIVLPDDGRFTEVEATVIDGALPDILAGGRPSGLGIKLPKWTFRSQVPLNDILVGLGMPTAFDAARADFHPMTEDNLDLYISAVLHQGFIAVDEDGTEAAAATAVVVTDSAAMLGEEFHVDRPFLYVIHDIEHGTPLFLGRVLDPTAG